MRLSHRLVSLLCLAALAAPGAADAATAAAKALRLRDMAALVEANKKPLSFDATVKASNGDGSATVTVKGSHNGKTASAKNMAMEMKVAVDATVKDVGTYRAEGRMVLAKQTLYVILDSVKVEIDDAALSRYDAEFPGAAGLGDELSGMADDYVGTWLSMPLEADDLELLQDERSADSRASLRELEPYFTVVQKTVRDRVTYAATIPASKKRRMLQLLAKDPGYAGVTDGLGAVLRNAKVDATFSLDTVKGALDSFKATFDLKATVDGDQTTVSVRSAGKVLAKAPVITAPTGSTPFEEFLEGLWGGMDFGGDTIEDARDAQRRSDVHTINDAIYQYAIDHDGDLPMDIPEGRTIAICKSRTPCVGASFDALLESYLIRIPEDPSQDADALSTGYTVRIGTDGRITIAAPLAEAGDISFSR